MNCRECTHYTYDRGTGLGDCDLDKEDPEVCEDFYDRQTAKDDAKYGSCDKY